MESPFTEFKWEIVDLKRENEKLKERVIYLGDMVFKARELAEEIRKDYRSCSVSIYKMAKEFLES